MNTDDLMHESYPRTSSTMISNRGKEIDIDYPYRGKGWQVDHGDVQTKMNVDPYKHGSIIDNLLK